MNRIMANDYLSGDRVVWSAGPAYGISRGPGMIYGFMVYDVVYDEVLLAHVRFDDPGLDDEAIPLTELRREV